MGDAIGSAVADFNAKLIGLAEVAAGAALALVGFMILTGLGSPVARTSIRVAKVIR